jgi:hypothetical protein
MKLKIAAGVVAISFAVAGTLVAATLQDQSARDGQVLSQSTKSDSAPKEKPNGQAGGTFRHLGF